MQTIHIYIEEYTGDARPPTRTRNAARRARRRIRRALRAEQELEERLELAVMEQQALEYARFQRMIEEAERRREEEKKEEAFAEKVRTRKKKSGPRAKSGAKEKCFICAET